MATLAELYTPSFFTSGRLAPDYDKICLDTYQKSDMFMQAMQYDPIGLNDIGEGKKGKVITSYANDGGLSSHRNAYGDVDANVIAGVDTTVIMTQQAEKVVLDRGVERVHGLAEFKRQSSMALSRLGNTFAYLTFNADKTANDATIANNTGNVKYSFDGFKPYFTTHTGQVADGGSCFKIGDIMSSPNLKYKANDFLSQTASLVRQGATNIYCSRNAKSILGSLEANKYDYTGPYQFSRKVQTWEGLPIVDIVDSAIPESWAAIGEFVLFTYQAPTEGFRQMIPTDGTLIKTYPTAAKTFSSETGIEMFYAPVLVDGQCAALCFLSRAATPAG